MPSKMPIHSQKPGHVYDAGRQDKIVKLGFRRGFVGSVERSGRVVGMGTGLLGSEGGEGKGGQKE